MPATALDNLSINTIRFLSADAVQKANSGHPGLPMGAAAMAYVLWTRHLKHNPANPKWHDRDRLSNGRRHHRGCPETSSASSSPVRFLSGKVFTFCSKRGERRICPRPS